MTLRLVASSPFSSRCAFFTHAALAVFFVIGNIYNGLNAPRRVRIKYICYLAGEKPSSRPSTATSSFRPSPSRRQRTAPRSPPPAIPLLAGASSSIQPNRACRRRFRHFVVVALASTDLCSRRSRVEWRLWSLESGVGEQADHRTLTHRFAGNKQKITDPCVGGSWI